MARTKQPVLTHTIGSGYSDTDDWMGGLGNFYNSYSIPANQINKKSLLGNFNLNGLRNKFGKLNEISLRDAWNKGIGDPELLGWNKKSGLSVLGGNVGGLYTGGKGLIDAFRYLDSANKMSKAKQEGGDVQADILAAAASNPLYSQYLTQDEINTVNKIKRGNYNPEGTNPFDDMGAVGMGALKGGLSGLVMGGVPGAIVGALGSGANAGIQSRRNAQERTNTQLESLLQSLNDASAQYKSMRRPNFTTLGIQNRFQDLYR